MPPWMCHRRVLAAAATVCLFCLPPADAASGHWLLFDGGNDRVRIADAASLRITQAITLEAWIQPASVANSVAQDRIIHKLGAYELVLSTRYTGCSFGSRGDVQWRTTVAGKIRRLCGGKITPGLWHHVAATFDGSTFRLYVNGTQVATGSLRGLLASTAEPLYLGNVGAANRGLHGGLDQVRIWNRARSAAEIAAGKDVALSGVEPGLVAYFPLDEGSGQVVTDGSAMGNHGVLGSGAAADNGDPRWVIAPPSNTPPQVDAGGDVTIRLPVDSVTLLGSASDDGLPAGSLALAWSPVSGPAPVSFEDPAAAATTATFSVAGTYTLRFAADDGALQASDTLTVMVLPRQNQPPQVDAGTDRTATGDGVPVLLEGVVSDDGLPGGPLVSAWTASSGPDAVTFQDSSAPATSASFSKQGSYELRLSAYDGELDASDTLTVTVGPAGEAVTIDSPQDGATLTGSTLLSASVQSPAPVASLRFLVNGVKIGEDASPPYQAQWDANSVASGVYTLQAIATDVAGDQYGASATLYVDSLAQAPASLPVSVIITGVQWAPSRGILRAASGSDTWPVTWADDGNLYTAYADGWGFAPGAPAKLSLGFARVSGPATGFVGQNIPSQTGEQTGNARAGKKASGMLMVQGVLYAWVRNADQQGRECQLAWSEDRAQTWQWSGWRFPELGFCTFVNFGENYAGARDSYVYMYSPNSPDAYKETDALVLTRVPANRIGDRASYEFYAGKDAGGTPVWSADIAARAPVLVFPGGVLRHAVTWYPALGRYLMTMRSRGANGGLNQFSLLEAPEPWGPWHLFYYTQTWEGGPMGSGGGAWGESQQIPAKWMDRNGRAFYLVFSGDDSFAVRHVGLTLR